MRACHSAGEMPDGAVDAVLTCWFMGGLPKRSANVAWLKRGLERRFQGLSRRAASPGRALQGREPVVSPVRLIGSRETDEPETVLLWPRPLSDIEPRLGQTAADFLVVDTNSVYELQKLSKLRACNSDFRSVAAPWRALSGVQDHVAASDCRFHIAGMKTCHSVLQALRDPSLAHASIDELLAAIAPARSRAAAPYHSSESDSRSIGLV